GVVAQQERLLQLVLGLKSDERREYGADRRQSRQHRGQHLHVAGALAIAELQGWREVHAECGIQERLVVDVGRLAGPVRVVAEPEEARRAAAIVDALERERPALLAQLATEKARVDLTLDPLLGTADHGPLRVGGRITEDAHAAAPAEVLAVDEVR